MCCARERIYLARFFFKFLFPYLFLYNVHPLHRKWNTKWGSTQMKKNASKWMCKRINSFADGWCWLLMAPWELNQVWISSGYVFGVEWVERWCCKSISQHSLCTCWIHCHHMWVACVNAYVLYKHIFYTLSNTVTCAAMQYKKLCAQQAYIDRTQQLIVRCFSHFLSFYYLFSLPRFLRGKRIYAMSIW